jgi:enoyl-CoA hydratase
MNNHILVAQDGPILRITLNRPDAGNAMTDDMATELIRLLEGAGETSQFVVLQGAGTDFCVGRAAMMQAPGATPAARPEALARRHQTEVVFNCYGAFRRCPVPIVAVVHGRALGFGCAVAALADITIASDAATFQIPEMNMNIMPTMVMSALVDRVPRKAINYLVYSRATVDAARALTFGIVSDVVPAGPLENEVSELCAALLKAPRAALLGVKEYTRSAPSMDVQGAVDFARNLHATINSSSEMRK